MLNTNDLWKEIQQQEPTAYMTCASTCKIFVGETLIAEHESISTAVDFAWLKICKPPKQQSSIPV